LGSQGELFSITDNLSGSLFSVNDISGLPILEVFSDDTVLIGDSVAPALNTTKRVSITGSTTIYSMSTASYDGMFVEYTIRSGSNARMGQFMAMWSGVSTVVSDVSTVDFGNTSGVAFTSIISGSNMVMTGSASAGTWTGKFIIRTI
jgi:predicted RecA/RadA family phage recombinase